MQKVVIHRAGGYEQLRLEEHPSPQPALDEVRIRTLAIGVNYADCIIRMGLYASAKEYVGWPITPGFEVAGVVDALGSGVRDLALGSVVMAATRFGGYATEVVVPRHQVFPIPAWFSIEEAAGFPAIHMTAHWALHGLAHVRSGETLLVHSAAGGVGGALVQLGVRAGCRVVGVVGRRAKIETALAHGCAAVIATERDDLWARARALSPRGYDVILDANGASTLKGSYEHLASPGKLVIYGFHSMLPKGRGRPSLLKLARTWLATPRFDPLRMTGENKSVLALNLSYLFERRDLLEEAMRDLLLAAERSELRPPPIRTFPLRDVAAAHRALESGDTVGKLILVP